MNYSYNRYNNDGVPASVWIIGLVLLAALCFAVAPDHMDADAIRILKSDGVSEITDEGIPWFGCSDSDIATSSRKFRGIKNGQRVEGVICRGFMKGATIRYF